MTTNDLTFNPDYRDDAPKMADIETWTGYAILEFGAPWCGHCQAAESVVKDVVAEHPQLPHIKIADGRGKKLGRIFKVKLWPTLVLLKDGQEVSRIVRPTGITEVRDLLAGI
ncbi:thioredoxin family protein [Moritella sp. Urea-trap-13]|uniref:thioredoxin family protein n=1 Tax=Moritella sp. Urea-trap-13 TaxID=2058327 RepID=UPI000C3203AE|nr:thioredoxin family protein [Moritella sp. Urea-trap-13]PKH09401.1 thioredoxin [Moritella sp. Urea-trap-13]